MKKTVKILSLLLAFCMAATLLAACNKQPEDEKPAEEKDYAGQISFNPDSSDTAKTAATVKSFIDGDTTHFSVSDKVIPGGVLKARYIAINTPESTGKIEEYGKTASEFTKSKLKDAKYIYLESDTATWEPDSTGSRYLAWVWYKTSNESEWRNLNIEILQNGLAIASSAANNKYGSVAVAAIEQAKALKYNIYSGQKDPNFFYGDAIELSLRELRTNISEYNGLKVAFEGVITQNNNNGVYIEEFDAETNVYYGIYIYYGFGLSGDGLEILNVGNRSRIVGTVSLYETGGTWQVSGLTYRAMKPDDPGNIKKISDGNQAAYTEISAEQFLDGKVIIETDDGKKEIPFAEASLNSTVSIKGLVVDSVYTTESEESSSKGAMTLTCHGADGRKISVRTVVLHDENNNIVTKEAYQNKTIDVKGIIDFYNGGYEDSYQIKVFKTSDITVIN